MKKVLLGLALCAFMFASCEDENKGNGNGNENEGGNGTVVVSGNTISGTLKRILINYDDYSYSYDGNVTNEIDKIKGYFYGNTYYDKGGGMIAAEAPVSNGQFSITLKAPTAEYLEDIAYDIPSTLTISDPNAKWGDIDFEGYKNEEYVSSIHMYPANLSEETEYELMYVDRDVTIKGSFTEEGYDDEYYTKGGDTYTVTVDLKLKKGLNVTMYKETKTGATITTSNTSNAVWGVRIYPSYDDDRNWDYPEERRWNDDGKEYSFGKSIRKSLRK